MKNNLDTINDFFQNNDTCLIINKISDEIDYFYLYLITYYAENHDISISYNSNNLDGQTDDLFARKEVNIIFYNSLDLIDKSLKKNDKRIFFTNYKTYKILKMKYSSINTYNFKSDVVNFLQNILGISNQILHSQIIQHPEFTYSEISKYLVINKISSIEIAKDNNDQLLEIRKKLYLSKNDKNINYQSLYRLLKEELNFKKFNFLTS